MLSKNEEKLIEVRAKTAEILEDLTISQKLALQALETCDSKSFEQVKVPLKQIHHKTEEIDFCLGGSYEWTPALQSEMVAAAMDLSIFDKPLTVSSHI